VKTHPAADLFPLLTGSEFTELCESIRENGQRQPVRVLPDGRIVDGRNRWRACEAIGREAMTLELQMDDLDVLQFVIDENVRRRHLSSSQAAACAVEFLPLEEEYALQRKAAAGRKSAPGKPAKDSQIFDYL